MLLTLKKHQKNLLVFGLAAGLFYLSFLYKIEALPIRHCDEGLVAVQAQEILISGDYLIGSRHFEIDHWGSKPQLVQWLDVAFMNLLGMREFSVRMPSVLGALGIFMIFFFWIRLLNLPLHFFLLTCFIFVTIPATTYHIHSYRTGDPDALMVFFLFLSAFQGYIILFSKKDKKINKHLFYFFSALFLAFMSKGSHVLIFLPGMGVLMLLYRKDLIPHFIVGGILVLLMVAFYYFLRNVHQPGYLTDVWNNELGGRYLESLEGNSHSFFYYIKNSFVYRNPFWSIIATIITAICLHKRKVDSTVIYLGTLILCYLLFVSLSQTKLEWYEMTIYPLLCMFTAYALHQLLLNTSKNKKGIITIFALILIIPCYTFTRNVQSLDKEIVEYHDYFYKICYFLREPLPASINERTKFIHNGRDGFFEHVLFYTHKNCWNGTCISWKGVNDLFEGDTVLIHQQEVYNEVLELYEMSEILRDDNVQLLKLESKKNP